MKPIETANTEEIKLKKPKPDMRDAVTQTDRSDW